MGARAGLAAREQEQLVGSHGVLSIGKALGSDSPLGPLCTCDVGVGETELSCSLAKG